MLKLSLGTVATAGVTPRVTGSDSSVRIPHFVPQAKHVIFCFMQGGMSHVDIFDPKPVLDEYDGRNTINDNIQSQGPGSRQWLASPWKFRQHGESGIPFSSLLPHLAACADDVTIIRSMRGGLPLHSVGNLFLHSGRNRAGFPSWGAWINYGLGSENSNLPGHILMHYDEVLPGGMENFSNGFLPAQHQATPLRADGIPLDNLQSRDRSAAAQQIKLEFLQSRDRTLSEELGGQRDIDAAVLNYQLARRMQDHLPRALNIEAESRAVQKLYGLGSGDPQKERYATHCLRARRLIEAGVRFIEIVTPPGFSANGSWDQHGELRKGHGANCFIVDQPIAALIRDLKSRGLFDETIIVVAGEMGRTPHSAGRDGRDHHTSCYSILVAGGGFQRGFVYGRTDDFGMSVVENPVTVHDLHATVLHQLGIDHEALTYRFGGRDFTLPDVEGRVNDDLIRA
ncbi:MAG: DUF1501 domain-containing protein [Planctomycetaceae bacterium]